MQFVLDVPVGSLRFSMAVLVPCDHQAAKALFIIYVSIKQYGIEKRQIACS